MLWTIIKWILIVLGIVLIGCFGIIVGIFLIAILTPKEKPISGKIHVTCIGDSITFGAGVLVHRKRDAWVYSLGRLLGDKYQTINYGISGATLLNEANQPYKKDKRAYYDAAKQEKPEILILMLGTNDSKKYNWNKEAYRNQLDEWIRDIKSWENLEQFYIMTPPFACITKGHDKIQFDIDNDVIRDEIYPIVCEKAKEYQIQLIDLFHLTENHPEYYADGVHLNALGNKVAAKFIYENMRL